MPAGGPGCDSASSRQQIADAARRRALAPLMAFEFARTRDLFLRSGRPLAHALRCVRASSSRLVVAGGMRILGRSTPCRATSSATGRCSRRLDWADDARLTSCAEMTPDEILPAEGGAKRLELLLQLSLPAAATRRRAITALYAFCREVDDVVDETPTSAVARTKLAWWRAEVRQPLRAAIRSTRSRRPLHRRRRHSRSGTPS